MASADSSNRPQYPFCSSNSRASSARFRNTSGHKDLGECWPDSSNPAATDNSVDYSVDNSNDSSTTNANSTNNITIHHQYVAGHSTAETLRHGDLKVPLPGVLGTRLLSPHEHTLPSTSTSPACKLSITSTGVVTAFNCAVENIRAYTSQVGTRKRTSQYRLILKQFRREIEIEQTKYQEAFLVMLDEILQLPELFISEKSSKMVILEGLKLVLGEVARRFQSINQKHLKYKGEKASKLCSELESERTRNIELIRKWTAQLAGAQDGGHDYVESPPPISSRHVSKTQISELIEYHRRTETHAKLLYNTLKEMLESPECRCGLAHTINLQLHIVAIAGIGSARRLSKRENPKFHLLCFAGQYSTSSIPQGGKEVQIEHVIDSEGSISNSSLSSDLMDTDSIFSAPAALGLASNYNRNFTFPQTSKETTSTKRRRKETTLSENSGSDTIPINVIRKKTRVGEAEATQSPQPCQDHSRRVGSTSSIINSGASVATMPPHAHGHCSTLPNPSKLVSSIFSQNNKKPKKKVSFQPTISNGHDTLKDQDRMSISYISQFPLAAVAKCFCSMVTFKSSDAQPSTHMHMDLGSELVGSIKTKSSTTCIVSHVPPKFRVIHQAQQSCLNSENSHAQLISLSQLISTRQEHYEKPTQYDRVVLAVKLVFAVMQLGTTEWLNQEWSADDILFPLPEVENRYRHVNILQKPLVQRKFNAIGLKGGRESLGMDTTPQSQSHSATTSATHSIVGSNRGLYCLGIILMELYHWQPFSKLYSPEQYPTPDYAAWHLAQNFEKDACNDLQYADTVRRCIRGMDVRGEESLERDVYRRAVYEKVVEPLEVYLRKFVGEEAFMELIS